MEKAKLQLSKKYHKTPKPAFNALRRGIKGKNPLFKSGFDEIYRQVPYTYPTKVFVNSELNSQMTNMNLFEGDLKELTKYSFGQASNDYGATLASSILGEDPSLGGAKSHDPDDLTPVRPGDWGAEEDQKQAPPEDGKKIFRKGWIKLKQEFATQSDADIVVKARNAILLLLTESKLVYEDTIQTLDHEWEYLGTQLVVTWLGYILIKSTDQRLLTKDGLMGLLIGLKEGKLRSENSSLQEMLEKLVSADLTLCSREVTTFRESQTIAEKQWREQSSVISTYITKLEGLMKEAAMTLSAPKPEKSVPRPGPKVIPHEGGYQYETNKDKIIKGTRPGHTDPQTLKVLNQVTNIMKIQMFSFRTFYYIHPELIAIKFWELMKIVRSPKEAIERLYQELAKLDPIQSPNI